MDLRFAPPPRRVLVVAAAFSQHGYNNTFEDLLVDDIVERTGYARRTVYLAIAELVEAGALLVRDVSVNGQRSFRPIDHSIWDAADAVVQP